MSQTFKCFIGIFLNFIRRFKLLAGSVYVYIIHVVLQLKIFRRYSTAHCSLLSAARRR